MAMDSDSNVFIAEFRGLRMLDDATVEWAKNRGISRETLECLRVISGTVYFGEADRKYDAIVFRHDGGFKARALASKYFTSAEKTKAGFWGLRDVLAGPLDEVYIVEGEMDRCAVVETGIDFRRVLAAPGASGKKETKLGYVQEALEAGLSKVKTFILCTDHDDAGLMLRTQLAQVLGAARCVFVRWKDEGIKDANDYLRSEGPAALRDTLEKGRLVWPVDGIYKMSEYPEPPKLRCWDTGFEEWGGRVKLATGTISVVTGQPGHGKTQIWAQLWFNIVKNYDLIACIASFETTARPYYQRILRQLHAGQGIWTMSLDQIRAADRWIDDHFYFLAHPDGRPTLAWVLEQSEIAIVRMGARIIQVDPWNRLESQREPGESETDYILRCLRTLRQFAVGFQAHVQILAHPAKRDYGGRSVMPVLEDVAGSKHWENIPDQGFSVWRPQIYDDKGVRQTYAELHHLKARFEDLGYPSKFGLDYDLEAGRFCTCQLRKKSNKKKIDED